MGHFLTTIMRRAASTSFVLFALFVACVSVQASPCDAPVDHIAHAALMADDIASGDDIDPTPSLEDNTVTLDDTFDVPAAHALHVARGIASRLAALTPDPHAHHHSFELRPPIA